MANTLEVEDVALQRRRTWFNHFIWWKRLSWTLTVSIIAGSTFVASSLSDSYGRPYVALAVAAFAAIQATVRPYQMALKYRQAWIELDHAIMTASGVRSPLIEAMRDGERYIEETYAELETHRPHERISS